jgi:hypothetical protein
MSPESAQVTIVASSAETLDGLQSYLSRAGLGSHATRELAGAARKPCSVLVLFPDEFSLDDVLSELRRLRREQPNVLPLVVTGVPARYEQTAAGDEKARVPLVIARPAWGWTILDAIRAALESLADE